MKTITPTDLQYLLDLFRGVNTHGDDQEGAQSRLTAAGLTVHITEDGQDFYAITDAGADRINAVLSPDALRGSVSRLSAITVSESGTIAGRIEFATYLEFSTEVNFLRELAILGKPVTLRLWTDDEETVRLDAFWDLPSQEDYEHSEYDRFIDGESETLLPFESWSDGVQISRYLAAYLPTVLAGLQVELVIDESE